MFEVSEEQQLSWHSKIESKIWFRRWWQFWSNYSAVFFVLAFLTFIGDQDFFEVLMVSGIGFVLTRGVIVVLINLFYKKERPYQKYNFSPITSRFFSGQTTEHNSFPSRHLTTLGTLTGAIILFTPIIGWVLVGVSIMTGIARIILGYHHPTDILAGFIIGLITAFFSFQLCFLFIFT